MYGTHRIVASDTASVVRSQFQSIRRCVDQFKAHRVGAEAYALVLITQHDLSWQRAITLKQQPTPPSSIFCLGARSRRSTIA